MNKKKLKWILLSVFSLFLITCITFSLLILDPSFNYYQVHSTDTYLGWMFADALRNTKENKKINYQINEDDLNVLFSFSNSLINVKIIDDHYCFFVKDNFLFIPTKIVLDTTLEKSQAGFIFHINSIKNGRLNTYGILSSTGKLHQIDLEKIFADVGLSMKFDYEHSQILYLTEDFNKDMNNKILFYDDELILNIVENVSKSYEINDGFNVSLDLSNNIYNNSKCDGREDSNHYAMNSSLLGNILNEMDKYGFQKTDELNNGALEVTAFNVNINAAPYVESATSIHDLALDRIEEKPVSEYAGSSYDKEVASFNELDLDLLLLNSKIIGSSSLFYSDNGLSFVVIDRVYVDIFTNDLGEAFINYIFGININGLETRIIVETKALNPIDEFACDFAITNIYYGSEIPNASFKSYGKTLLSRVLSKLDYITAKTKNNLVTIDFKPLFEDESLASYKSIFYDSIGTRKLVVNSSHIKDVGSFSLRFARE